MSAIFSEETISIISKARTEAIDFHKKKRKEAEEAQKIAKVWKDLANYMDSKWYFHLIDLFERNSSFFRSIRGENNSLIICLEEIYKKAVEEKRAIIRRYPDLLSNALSDNGLPLGRDSAHPRYRLMDNFFAIEIIDGKGIAKLSDYAGSLHTLPADIEALILVVRQEYERIFNRHHDNNVFLRTLRQQYLRIISNEGKDDGAQVPIRQISRSLMQVNKSYKLDEFLIDLSYLVKEGPVDIDGYVLNLQNTRDTEQGIILWGNEKRGQVGFLAFIH